MAIKYTDGQQIESRILEIVTGAQELASTCQVGREHYGEWAVRYHLCPERANLVRHLDFNGLEVLELGAGMGGVSRFLAESSKHLTVVEGTQARFDVLKSRLRDLKNWDGVVANVGDVRIDRKFDVVCVIGVLEYSELYIKPGPQSGGDPYVEFLLRAKSFLKPGGVLVLAIENQLGLKYWSGCAEDHTGKLFDSVTGYPFRPSPRTFSLGELRSKLSRSGFVAPHAYLPFPDYKIPKVVLSEELPRAEHRLAAELAVAAPYETYTGPRMRYFPDALAAETMSEAGLLAELSNSFLMVASLDANSDILSKVERRSGEGELGWHYSTGRQVAVETVFRKRADAVTVEKKVSGSFESLSGTPYKWTPTPSSTLLSGRSLRSVLARCIYFEDWTGFENAFSAFLRWSLDHWKGDGRSLDAIWVNAFMREDQVVGLIKGELAQPAFELFDLEWSCQDRVSDSYFIFRNVITLVRELHAFKNSAPFFSLRDFYERICGRLSVASHYEANASLEAEFQAAADGLRDAETKKAEIDGLMGVVFSSGSYPRVANSEREIELIKAEVDQTRGERDSANRANADLQRAIGDLQVHVRELEKLLQRPQHKIAGKLGKLVGKMPGLKRGVDKALRKP